MSAFLVDISTIHKILTQIEIEVNNSNRQREMFKERLGVNFTENDWMAKLGQNMLDLNQLALKHRYGDRKRQLKYTFEPVICTHIQAFKALQCWLYQCMEGDIPEQSNLFKFFKKVIVPNWAISIVMRTPEYDEAEWG